jgi:hypothetical protein
VQHQALCCPRTEVAISCHCRYTNTANSIFWFHYGKAVFNIIWGSIRNKCVSHGSVKRPEHIVPATYEQCCSQPT